MGDTGSMLLAAEIKAGNSAFLVVLLLALAAGALFFFMIGSLRRMRANVERGEFGVSTRQKGRDRRGGPSAGGEATGKDGAEGGGGAPAAASDGPARAEVPAQAKPGDK